MTTRTIIARDMQQAMSQAKQELGAEAIILKSRRLGDQIEVTVTDDPSFLLAFSRDKDAANDNEHRRVYPTGQSYLKGQDVESSEQDRIESSEAYEAPVSRDLFPSFQQSVPDSVPSEAHEESTIDSSHPAFDKQIDDISKRFDFRSMHDPALKRLIGELRSIGEFWNEFGIYWENFADSYQYPWSKQLRERIEYLHLAPELRDRLVRQFREFPEFDESWKLVLAELQNSIRISRNDIISTGGNYAFVGPSGAGKTTTIGKIAAEYVLQHGPEKVGLITTDIFRIAAYEQLVTIGKILDVDVEVVDAHQGGLVQALDRFADKSLVLVDTAGLRRTDKDLAQQLAEIRQQGQRLQTMLVLPANIQYESMQAAAETYEVDDFCGCIFTRLDECSSLGAAVSLLVNSGIPVAYLASGHTIPDDLARANSLLIIEQLLSFACQDTDVSRIGDGGLSEGFCPGNSSQLDLI